jgi:molybdate transport system regulatory protein
MQLSTRNQISGTVTGVVRNEVVASVKVTLSGGATITAVITSEAVDELGLVDGAAVKVLVKATEVMLATD